MHGQVLFSSLSQFLHQAIGPRGRLHQRLWYVWGRADFSCLRLPCARLHFCNILGQDDENTHRCPFPTLCSSGMGRSLHYHSTDSFVFILGTQVQHACEGKSIPMVCTSKKLILTHGIFIFWHILKLLLVLFPYYALIQIQIHLNEMLRFSLLKHLHSNT